MVMEYVYAILNEYEHLCISANIKIFNPKIIKRIRGNALVQTFYDYRSFIQKQREIVDREAWSETSRFIRTHCWRGWRKRDPDLRVWNELSGEKITKPRSGRGA
jgi:hypothetical protein